MGIVEPERHPFCQSGERVVACPFVVFGGEKAGPSSTRKGQGRQACGHRGYRGVGVDDLRVAHKSSQTQKPTGVQHRPGCDAGDRNPFGFEFGDELVVVTAEIGQPLCRGGAVTMAGTNEQESLGSSPIQALHQGQDANRRGSAICRFGGLW